MKLKEIYELAVKSGMDVDPRDEAEVKKVLKKVEEEYKELDEEEKEFFDQDSLENPYPDTRILTGDEEAEVERVLMGIDIDTGEVLLADRLTEKGTKIDAVIAHHPGGKALAGLHEVMHMQEEILHDLGVPINVAEGIMAKRISEVKRGIMPLNHNKARDAAKLFDLPLICVHTPSDNLVVDFLQNKVDQADLETVGDVVELLKEIPEYKEATKLKAGPNVVVGDEKRSAGKVVVEMTGGTGGSKKAFEKLAQAGVGTLVCMHIGEEHRKKAEENHINVIIAGHMASDSVGMNLFADQLEEQGVEVVPCSGLIRVSR
ncbi:Nif3-like dinuclear metal center hexameric protein [Natroniella sulfidigena]|uniref:Nif3-like dinuclear metal center hexameric protein n=1 Tax=Natroniella sulfidigena TaxID=723921 RepID=UPI00200A0AF5|nr:Nif3-like dinuclear metal center hexameric protein [Natroniella sulfidigena]MCK8818102.1 Nif3-like dinuclear metal center hexameric protein [Natroniella sulfidigena]